MSDYKRKKEKNKKKVAFIETQCIGVQCIVNITYYLQIYARRLEER